MTDVKTAYSYIRFSTVEQAGGDSLRRQSDAAERWCTLNGYQLSQESFRDLGLSAFKDANGEVGRLAEFKKAVDDGVIETPTVLLVESLDRISRAKPRKAVRALESLVDAGVTVVTLNDGQMYDADRLDNDEMAFMLAFMIAIRAHDESKVKSQRIGAAWKNKRAQLEAGAGGIYTRKLPAWLTVDGENVVEIPQAGDAIRTIYKLADMGVGQAGIAKQLNSEGVPVIGRAAHWSRSYVAKILSNRAVVGDLATVDGMIEGAYPCVVSKRIASRVWKAGAAKKAAGTTNRTIQHSLAGLAKCPTCGATMTRVAKGKRSTPKLVCVEAKAGRCTGGYRSVDVAKLEHWIDHHIPQLVATVPSGDVTVDAELEEARNSLEAEKSMLGGLLETAAFRPSAALADKIAEVEQAVESQKQAVEALERKALGQSQRTLGMRLERLEKARNVVEQNRAMVMLFDRVEVGQETLRYVWVHGGETELAVWFPDAGR